MVLIWRFLEKVNDRIPWIGIVASVGIAIIAPAPDFLDITGIYKVCLYVILILLILSLGVVSYFQYRKSLKVKELEEQISQQADQIDEITKNIMILFRGVLANLAERLKIQNDPESRVSIYVHNGDAHFIPCGRYSSNPNLKKKGRNIFPDNQGCIGKAWADGWCFDLFPIEKSKHKQICKEKYDIPDQVHASLNMISRLYAVKRINKTSYEPLAVIVFESKKVDKFMEGDIKDHLEAIARDYATTISAFLELIIDANTTKGAGL